MSGIKSKAAGKSIVYFRRSVRKAGFTPHNYIK